MRAVVAELADAPALGAGERKLVGVRVPSAAPTFLGGSNPHFVLLLNLTFIEKPMIWLVSHPVDKFADCSRKYWVGIRALARSDGGHDAVNQIVTSAKAAADRRIAGVRAHYSWCGARWAVPHATTPLYLRRDLR